MTSVPFLSTPEPDAQPGTQADWLELAAFFSRDGTALLTELVNQQDLDRDREPDDFGELEEQWNVGQAVYLFCLVLSHAPQSELVPKGSAPPDDQLREARDLFQVCST